MLTFVTANIDLVTMSAVLTPHKTHWLSWSFKRVATYFVVRIMITTVHRTSMQKDVQWRHRTRLHLIFKTQDHIQVSTRSDTWSLWSSTEMTCAIVTPPKSILVLSSSMPVINPLFSHLPSGYVAKPLAMIWRLKYNTCPAIVILDTSRYKNYPAIKISTISRQITSQQSLYPINQRSRIVSARCKTSCRVQNFQRQGADQTDLSLRAKQTIKSLRARQAE